MNKPARKYISEISRGLQIQIRVIGALLMREIITRYGRNNVGFLWLLLEPILFTVGVVVLWSLMHKSTGFRVDIVPFVVTGYSSLLLWRNCSFRGIKAIEPNRSLMHHRQVKIIDIFIARMLLELAGVTTSFLIVIISMLAIGLMSVPSNPLLMLCGWALLCWFSAALGTILGCLSEHSDLVERLWHPASYFLLAVSGTFFMVDWLPTSFREIVLWIPMPNAVEMMRGGYWGDAVKTYYSVGYTAFVCLSVSLIALLLLSDRRMKMLT